MKMLRTLAITSLITLSFSFLGCAADSPITKHGDYKLTKSKWNGPLLLPTKLPNSTEVESIQYIDQIPLMEIRMTDLYLTEQKSTEKTITHLSHDQSPDETIDSVIDRVHLGSVGNTNNITKIEKEMIGQNIGYWYEMQTRDTVNQVVEFVQDGIHVYLQSSEDGTLEKDTEKNQLLDVAKSFKLVD
ncbi:MAG: hypothetical protein ACXVDJ_00685 [Tumebacillaceae bacterium]